MKKLLSGIFILACGATWVQADELKFVTALSQPIGAFAHVESINQKRPSETFFVNFCNTGVNTGKIEAKGLVKMNEMRLTSGSRAGSSEKMTYQIIGTKANSFAIRQGGSLAGAKLLADTANPRDVVVDAGVQVGKASTFIAADLPSLAIGTHTKIEYPGEYLTGQDVRWYSDGDDEDYRYTWKVDAEKGIVKNGSTEYNSWPIRTKQRASECICGNSVSPFNNKHCTQEWNYQTCSGQVHSRRVGLIYYRFDYKSGSCKWYETDPKGTYSTTETSLSNVPESTWKKWTKWTTIPKYHNCQCKGYNSGYYSDYSASSYDQSYGNPKFKSGMVSGDMTGSQVSATRTRACRYDKVKSWGYKYDGEIKESYDFANCQWKEISNTCTCSVDRASAPQANKTSGTFDRTRQCETDSRYGTKYDGTITARYYFGKGNCYWNQYEDTDCWCSTTRAEAPEKRYYGYGYRTRQCSSENAKWTGTITDRYNYSSCYWQNKYDDNCKCANMPSSLTRTESCGEGYEGQKKFTYNTNLSVCAWEETSNTCVKMCDKEVGSGRYNWEQTSIVLGLCNQAMGCRLSNSSDCNYSCNKTTAGKKCTKYTPAGRLEKEARYTQTTSECKEIMETKKVPCSEL